MINHINRGDRDHDPSGDAGEGEPGGMFVGTVNHAWLAGLHTIAVPFPWPQGGAARTRGQEDATGIPSPILSGALDELPDRTEYLQHDGLESPETWAQVQRQGMIDLRQATEEDLPDWQSLLDALPVDPTAVDAYFSRLGSAQ